MDLLGDYGSDDDDDSDTISITPTTRKRKRSKEQDDTAITPPPITIVPSQSIKASTFVRSTPHVPGNWAGHVFAAVIRLEDWRNTLTESLHRFQVYLEKIGFAGGTVISHLDSNELHMSLARPFTLQLGSIQPFVQQLEKRLCHLPTITLCINPCDEKVLVNDDRTRSFWTLPIHANPTLRAIVEEVDAVLQNYNQPAYYNPPVFHVSVASVVGDLEALANRNCQQTKTAKSRGSSSTKSHTRHVNLKQVQCSFGNTKCYSINLLQR
ncbi:U6 snRNA phosphodiesterase [Seminavis robusta]|uniref:U6 snRNA phosphodiesterase 1 n=1 Tax=Seminavis robusta TaxID=568900 RepID=A0A9N8EIX7_9STRA|nr:U6 snRNA phosphodiesterase [Seminavis robusta]|eukprot:Sro1062_g236960.1 U6 snRNA phosphodiesterase (267) ;mRNA; f:18396-19196